MPSKGWLRGDQCAFSPNCRQPPHPQRASPIHLGAPRTHLAAAVGQVATHWRAGFINPYKIVYSLADAQPHENPGTGSSHPCGNGCGGHRVQGLGHGQRGSAEQIQQAARHHLGGAAQVLQVQALIGPFGMRLQHGARSRAVNHAGDAAFHIQAHIGV